MKTFLAVLVTAVGATLIVAAPTSAVSNPPVVNPLDINPFFVARSGQPCAGPQSVPLVGQLGQFYECNPQNKWVPVQEFADPYAVNAPVGSAITQYGHAGAPIPHGYLEMNGQAFDPAIYPDLSTQLGSNNVPNLGGPAGAKGLIKALP